MTILEYLASNDRNLIITADEYGNRYIENMGYGFCDIFIYTDRLTYVDDDVLFMPKDVYEKLSEIEILIHDKEADSSYIRRPYFRMRGCPISEEQAFEIISRCDRYLGFEEEIRKQENYVGSFNFQVNTMWVFYFPRSASVVTPDGRVGINAITTKYPDMEELITDLFKFIAHFPYLDFVVAMSTTDDFWWEEGCKEKGISSAEAMDQAFYDIIDYAFYVHDKKVEVVGREEAIRLYKEYEKKCGFPSENYNSEYYEDREEYAADIDYVRRCAECYDIDVDQFMENYIKERKRR